MVNSWNVFNVNMYTAMKSEKSLEIQHLVMLDSFNAYIRKKQRLTSRTIFSSHLVASEWYRAQIWSPMSPFSPASLLGYAIHADKS